jgi:hypothetical protein
MLIIAKSIALITLTLADVSNFITFRQCVYEKLEKKLDLSFRGRPRTLLARHASVQSEISGPLCHVIVLQVEHHMLPS